MRKLERFRLISSIGLTALLVVGGTLIGVGGGPASAGDPAKQPGQAGVGAADPAVISDWNATAVATIVTDEARSPAEAYVYFAFTHAAMYNAVVGITREYELYRWHRHGRAWASPEAAAASAAFHVLKHYFSSTAAQTRLYDAYAASLDGVPDGAAQSAGVRYGRRAAHRIINLRLDDGRYAPLEFPMPPGPGVWRPTADPPVAFSTPWLSKMTPLVMESPKQFRPGQPPALDSAKYARQFNEVKDLGAATGSVRQPWQTRTALFFSDIGVGGLQGALRDLVSRRGFDISKSAQLFAVAEVAAADGLVSCWDAKFHYGLWRPVTAIQLAEDDGNPATEPDPDWTSLIPSPPYPDYTSGLNTAVGSISRAVAHVLDTNRINLRITSTAAAETRHYRYAGALNRAAINARIWSGLHFRSADVVGNHRAQRIASYVFRHAFQPTN
jgi:hypothetical protein